VARCNTAICYGDNIDVIVTVDVRHWRRRWMTISAGDMWIDI